MTFCGCVVTCSTASPVVGVAAATRQLARRTWARHSFEGSAPDAQAVEMVYCVFEDSVRTENRPAQAPA